MIIGSFDNYSVAPVQFVEINGTWKTDIALRYALCNISHLGIVSTNVALSTAQLHNIEIIDLPTNPWMSAEMTLGVEQWTHDNVILIFLTVSGKKVISNSEGYTHVMWYS